VALVLLLLLLLLLLLAAGAAVLLLLLLLDFRQRWLSHLLLRRCSPAAVAALVTHTCPRSALVGEWG
jgi:hypothetical protein